eukprot:5985493-Pleurochrysis_carterae.AAC.3
MSRSSLGVVLMYIVRMRKCAVAAASNVIPHSSTSLCTISCVWPSCAQVMPSPVRKGRKLVRG